MIKRVTLTLVWLIIGLLGTAAIFFTGGFIINAQVPIKIVGRNQVSANEWDRGYVSMEGTWVIEGIKQAFPVQFTKIICFKQYGHCTSAQAEINFGDTLDLTVSLFEITKWDATTLVFTNTSPLCVDYVYTIDRSNLRTFGTRKPKNDAADVCKQMTPLTEQRDLKLTLVSGLTVWKQLRDEAAARTMPFVWAATAFWWVFVLYRIVQTWRPKRARGISALPSGHGGQHSNNSQSARV